MKNQPPKRFSIRDAIMDFFAGGIKMLFQSTDDREYKRLKDFLS
jgi:hypothetical protein